MDYWSMKMGNEPDVSEFISAIAAGNNAQLMVVITATTATSTTAGLVAAANQTGGRVVSIFKQPEELHSSKQSLKSELANRVDFILGDAESLMLNNYRNADLVVIDCDLENHEQILEAVIGKGREKSTIVLGYNAHWKDSWRWSRSNNHLLPIGEGLLLMRIGGKSGNGGGGRLSRGGSHGGSRKGHWVVKVDNCTGEEHVFKVKSPSRKALRT